MTHALHLALEHHADPAPGKHAACATSHAHRRDPGPPVLTAPTPPAHDPAQCPACQALAATKPLHVPRTSLPAGTEPLWAALAVVDRPPASSGYPGSLGPRAPPALLRCPTV